jgi:hypothetical protein
MKKQLLMTSAMILLGSVGMAATGSGFEVLSENGNRTAYLDHCGGKATLNETFVGSDRVRTPMLSINGVKNCSVVTVDGVEQSEKIHASQGGYADFIITEMPGLNIHTIRIESGSGKTSDTIQVISFGESSRRQSANPRANIEMEFGLGAWVFGAEKARDLNDCGGIVRVTVEGNQVRLTFNNVKDCSKFDILRANGDAVDYKVKSLQQSSRDNKYDGSFTLPKRILDDGNNSVKVILRSNSGKHDEVILLRFLTL